MVVGGCYTGRRYFHSRLPCSGACQRADALKRTGKPAAFVESDLVDPRYFSAANIKNRLESYFQMIDQKRSGATGQWPVAGICLLALAAVFGIVLWVG